MTANTRDTISRKEYIFPLGHLRYFLTAYQECTKIRKTVKTTASFVTAKQIPS